MLERVEVVVAGDADVDEHATVRRTRDVVSRLAPGVDVTARHPHEDDAHDAVPEPGRAMVTINGRIVGRTGPANQDPRGWMIEAALAHALEPRHILFMCVANSARSQLADCMAHHLAPAGVTVSSAGSHPTSLRPEVGVVLGELGLSADGLRSKGVDAVDVDTVQLLVTLCADEVCPTILKPVPRIHWPIDDPAAVGGDDETRLAAFRAARDTIRERLYALFNG